MGELARGNARNIRKILEAREGSARLYRTITAGPSGQRSDLPVGKVRYTYENAAEVEIIDRDGSTAGYASRTDIFAMSQRGRGTWTVWDYNDWDGRTLLGWASTLSLGCDVVLNGVHAATGRHDHARLSGGTWQTYTPEPEVS